MGENLKRALTGALLLFASGLVQAQWSIPDKGTAQNDIQSILFQEYQKSQTAGISGIDYVNTGCAPTAQGSPNMTVAIAACTVRSNNVPFKVAAGNATITTANATNPRIDLIVITSAGAIAVRAGTAAAAPKPPVRTANDVVLAAVYVPANDTTISSDQITDLRVILRPPAWDIEIIKSADQDVTNSSTLADDTDLQFSVGSGEQWIIEADLAYSGNTTAGDFKFDFLPSTGNMTGVYRYAGSDTTADAVNVSTGIRLAAAATITAVACGTAAAHARGRTIKVEAILTFSAAATFKFRFAQNTATASTAARMQSSSVLRARKIA